MILATGLTTAPAFPDDSNADFQAQRWVADPAKSRLGFKATQEGAEFSGRFYEFTTGLELAVSPEKYSLLQVDTTIQLTSVDTEYEERDDYLVQEDWFYTELWPQATFSSAVITDNGGGRFSADGKLELRGISKDVTVDLQLIVEENRERGKLLGSASINRLDFGVGQGDWSDTEWIGDKVKVDFELYILRAFE